MSPPILPHKLTMAQSSSINRGVLLDIATPRERRHTLPGMIMKRVSSMDYIYTMREREERVASFIHSDLLRYFAGGELTYFGPFFICCLSAEASRGLSNSNEQSSSSDTHITAPNSLATYIHTA